MSRTKTGVLCLLCLTILLFGRPLEAWRQWEYVNPSDVEIRVVPDSYEVVAGETATFTIRVRNRTDKAVSIPFATGQRWDLSAWHEGVQIWRWSNGLRWAEAPHSISIRAGDTETFRLPWATTDRVGMPLPQGVYGVQGMVMTSPRFLISNLADIRLLPPKLVRGDVIKVKCGTTFAIDVPNLKDDDEIAWRVEYDLDDNRISAMTSLDSVTTKTLRFRADRPGHTIMHLFGYPPTKNYPRSIERRTYRIEVTSD
ncbi:MAG: BsuPI-related putative proteinase inhibitor [Candidatus Ozemobacteraceae bacterium]